MSTRERLAAVIGPLILIVIGVILLLNQLDIISALNSNGYLRGSYCAEGGFAAIATPEPSTFLLLAVGLISMLLRRRRKA